MCCSSCLPYFFLVGETASNRRAPLQQGKCRAPRVQLLATPPPQPVARFGLEHMEPFEVDKAPANEPHYVFGSQVLYRPGAALVIRAKCRGW